MGEPKGLVVLRGRPWIAWQLDAVAGVVPVERVVVVLGHDRPRYELEVPDLRSRAHVVQNPDPDRGPFSSLQCGLAAIDESIGLGAGVFVLPVDVPAAAAEVWTALAAALTPSLDAVVPVHDGRGGHPVFLAGAFARHLRGVSPHSRLDAELAAAPERGQSVSRIEVADFRVRLNLNAPEDWAKLKVDPEIGRRAK
jgi:molybdenum cofactor cytidylyltransferase